MLAGWGSAYYSACAALYEASLPLAEDARALGRRDAHAARQPILYACPMHRRAYEKPQGYAGDYRLMELHFAHERSGDGLFGRFLHFVAQNYSLPRAVIAREAVLRDAVRKVLEHDSTEPARVLALAAGPAMEMRRLLEGEPTITRPVELILVDQDKSAHETAHRQLTRLLVERHQGKLPVTLTCLHFSVRQILKPKSQEEHRVVDEVLAGLDLVYCAGLYDYLPDPVATRLTSAMYSRLRPGGRMLMGNMAVGPDMTWMAEFVLDWFLHYRTPESMLHLGAGLSPLLAHQTVSADVTGHAIFLDVTKPHA
jgi:hypothetical protein